MFGKDNWIIIDIQTNRIQKSSDSLHGIRRSLTCLRKKNPDRKYTVMQRDEYRDPMVETKNLLNGKSCKIRLSQVGTCCDPGTERYWCQ